MAGVPENKRQLSLHVAADEYSFLRGEAKRLGMTTTMIVRLILRKEMSARSTAELQQREREIPRAIGGRRGQ